MTATRTARVLTQNPDVEHLIEVRVLEHFTFCGVEHVRWEPAQPLEGALRKTYAGWQPGALVLPTTRLV